jgi:hypothetical protein
METLKDLIEDLAKVVVEDFKGEVLWIGIHPKNTVKMANDANREHMLKAIIPMNCEFVGESLSYSYPTKNLYKLKFIWDSKEINPRIKNFGNLNFGFSLTKEIKNVFYAKRIIGKKFIFFDKTENIPELNRYLSSKVDSLVKEYEDPILLESFWGGVLNNEGLKLEVRQISEIKWAVRNREEKRHKLLKGAIDFNLKFFELLQSY